MGDVFVTGMGLVTPLGVGLETNETALREGRSGIVYVPEWKERGLESQVAGLINEDAECPLFNAKSRRFLSANSAAATVAAHEAILNAKLSLEELKGAPVPVILGCGGGAYRQIYYGAKTLVDTGKSKRISPFTVPQAMPSSAVASLSLILGVTGESYDISSACASGSHAIMVACRLLNSGLYDMVITGGTEELNWVNALGFDAMRATSRKYNNTPEKASRPFDRDRDGFVIAAGAGVLILENSKSMKRRGATPIARITGTSANSNAKDMVFPDADSNTAVMEMAIREAGLKATDIDYINTHGTATPVGDPVEMQAVKNLYSPGMDPGKVAINSTKSMTGHMIGATGAVEVIFSAIMISKKFICPSINLDNPEPEFAWADFVRKTRVNTTIRHAISNSFGFGGTNSCVVISAL